MNQPPQINIPLDKTKELLCKNCGSDIFSEGLLLRTASKFLAGTQQDAVIPIPVFYCLKCNTVIEETLPKGLVRNTLPHPSTKIKTD